MYVLSREYAEPPKRNFVSLSSRTKCFGHKSEEDDVNEKIMQTVVSADSDGTVMELFFHIITF